MAGCRAVVDDLVSELRETSASIQTLVDELRKGTTTTTQTVIHKSTLGGFVTGMAIAACIGSFWYTMDVARTLHNEIRDLTAWKDIYGRDLAAVKQQLQQRPGDRKP